MKRDCFELLEELLGYFPGVVVVGVRQCGKTTLLRQLPPGWRIYDLEKGSDYKIISQDCDLFFRLNSKNVAIDEGQLLPGLFPALRVAIDQERERPGRFIVTGSSSPELLSAVAESLAGRVAVIELSPFSPSEAFGFKRSDFYQLVVDLQDQESFFTLENRIKIGELHDFWFRGGYPEPWLKNNPRFSELWMQNYVQTYLGRDILRLFPGLNNQKFRLFLEMLGNLSGSIINYADVARAIGISQPTAREYFRIAHGTFLWRHIPSFEKNSAKRIVKHPKGYLRDTGLLHFLLHINRPDLLLAHPIMGKSWESMVVEMLLRGFHSLGVAFEYYHYRTSGGAEVDLVLEGNFGLVPIEIKYGQRVSLKDLRGIRDFIEERDCRLGFVISNDEHVRRYDERLIGIPCGCL